jgi:transcription antitermination factor NusG
MATILNSGDKVRVIAGPYLGWEGKLLRFEASAERVTVKIRVFGKRTVIELRPSEVQPV